MNQKLCEELNGQVDGIYVRFKNWFNAIIIISVDNWLEVLLDRHRVLASAGFLCTANGSEGVRKMHPFLEHHPNDMKTFTTTIPIVCLKRA